MHVVDQPVGDGITSACAEQTYGFDLVLLAHWDHLRVCGADPSTGLGPAVMNGSPPRVRSRPTVLENVSLPERITSACAEQTSGLSLFRK